MKRSSTSRSHPPEPSRGCTLLAFGAHPDDIEFGCGAVVALETQRGASAHFVVCSRGESATHGTPAIRTREARVGAAALGATLEFIELGGDAHFERTVKHALALAAVIRRLRPAIVLAPTVVENQHPDHAVLGALVRDAARLARYGGVKELRPPRGLPPHAIDQLHHYAITHDAQPRDVTEILVDVSSPQVVAAWTAAMRAHASQASTRDYVQLQLDRARLHGARCGASFAVPLFTADAIVVDSLTAIRRGARHF
ncbi:bacillithiol biosynthesis deacetylase BshB1 [Opitutales bacterium ASA1]|uniref:PIG-L family deacetylase n=1 Tax=Congregicoccus parvus TaxID=3081749 RepID=UPI002B2F524E|nr:bacillithiol biosynthesis deacetylase BshB1 [Opitutales bacterium ASA1]